MAGSRENVDVNAFAFGPALGVGGSFGELSDMSMQSFEPGDVDLAL